MSFRPEHIEGRTWHGRKGAVANSFRYNVDYVLFDPEAEWSGPSLLRRNAAGVMSLLDRDHGGPPKSGAGPQWARRAFEAAGIRAEQLLLLTQPRILGHVFNPVSFFFALDDNNALRAVIAEVSNTFGDRHSYLVRKADNGVITGSDRLRAEKVFHVSPFQPIAGTYQFRFDLRDDRLLIWIDHDNPEAGVMASLYGDRKPLTTRSALRALWRRPFGARRVLTLIHWQAAKLFVKGARYRRRTPPPAEELS